MVVHIANKLLAQLLVQFPFCQKKLDCNETLTSFLAFNVPTGAFLAQKNCKACTCINPLFADQSQQLLQQCSRNTNSILI